MFRFYIFLGIVFSIVFTPLHAQPPGTWNLVFEDNFDGNTLDLSMWSKNYPWGRTHNHRAYMADSMVYLENGILRIKGIDKRHPDAPAGTDKYQSSFGYLSFDYTAGAVHTNGKFNFTYGYAEGRFKVPSTEGTWPAFWTLNADGAWPPEIDILEIPGDKREHHYYYHYGPDWQNEASFGGTHWGPDKSQGFHTYGVDWGPDYMHFYFDGQRVGTYNGRSETTQGKDMYLLINLAIDGWAPTPPANAQFPVYYDCDWVRVWEKAPYGNLDLETGTLAPWGKWNDASVHTQCAYEGNYGLRLSGSPASSEQSVRLKPNTTYVYGGYGKTNVTGEAAMFGVKNYGGNQQVKVVSSTSWVKDSLVFTTGASNESATIFWYKDAGVGSACADNFFLYEASPCQSNDPMGAYYDPCGKCVGGNTGYLPCAELTEDVYTIRAVHSGLCLENKGNLSQENCNESESQQWKIIPEGDLYSIENLGDGSLLGYKEPSSSMALSTLESNKQLFRIEDAGDNNFHIVPAEEMDLAADVVSNNSEPGRQVKWYERNGQDNQKFILERADVITSFKSLPEPMVQISPNPSSGLFKVSGYESVSYRIYNQMGMQVISGTCQGACEVDLGHKPGLYFMHLEYDEETIIEKLMIRD